MNPFLLAPRVAEEHKMFTDRIRSFRRAENGVAAIETAIILPILLLLYFGMIDLTGVISLNRKVTYSASVVADLVSQNRTSVLKAAVDDYYNAAELVMAPTAATAFRVNVFGYRKVGGVATEIWKTSSGSGPTCSTVPDTAAMLPLMTADNDIVVAITCTDYAPYMANFMGYNIMGGATFDVEQAIMVRPRATTQLTCYQATVGSAVCT
jgi:Flp pilus assembly protein TadG